MKKKNGFTLIELLVVIAIIALLLSMLMPSLSLAREQARRVVCMSLLRSYGKANHTYAGANMGHFVPFSQATNDPSHKGPFGYWDERWPENKEFRQCLSADRKKVTESWNEPFEFPKELWCPSHKIGDPREYTAIFEAAKGWRVVMSYAMNTERWVSKNDVYNEVDWYPSDRNYRGHIAAVITRPSESMMFIDSNYYQTRYERADYTVYWDTYGDKLRPQNWAEVSYRHTDGANMVFFDGHVARLLKKDVYNDDNPVRPFAPNRRKPEVLWDVEYPTVGSEGLRF